MLNSRYSEPLHQVIGGTRGSETAGRETQRPQAQTFQEVFEERPELYSGSVDFLATNEYMNRPPMPPTYVFMFEVSTPAIESGYLAMATQTVKGRIEEQALPGGERVRVSFLAYDK